MQTSKCGIFLLTLLKQVGKPYIYGAEVLLDNPNPSAFDCSELVQWALAQAGLTHVCDLPIKRFDGAGNQFLNSRTVPISVAREHLGALLFIQDKEAYATKPARIGHVGVVIAPGYVVEARGRNYGVVISKITERWNLASKIPELYEE